MTVRRRKKDKTKAATLPDTPAALARAAQERSPEDIDKAITLFTDIATGRALTITQQTELRELLGEYPDSPGQAAEWTRSLKALKGRGSTGSSRP